ncbi:MAG: copper ion binding protein [Gammaproteobacteria bacterium]|nr:heavy-metal-associated domain-containing protein [Gammaproteobacteria bacterium]MDP7271018.1 copper ion binding protein [Gammaproteobacteria bacterium]MDP7418641.1 copper ion binding protein [Gammaproteobacteria bacterium]MDP7660883.1 copper ion binding protein [Gammaproteobacteria bacterium]HJP37717.1 copper ion binding protein [Gammaproteobacteria bacterium]
MKTATIKVKGMTCGGCVKSIENALYEQTGIQKVAADLDAGTVAVDFDVNVIQTAAIEQAIEKAGFDIAA